METNNTELSDAGLLFFFIHNRPLKRTVRRNSLFLRAMLKIMTQYEVITELIIHLKESAAIFWFLDTKPRICETDITPLTSALQIHPYTNSSDAIMSYTVKQTTVRNVDFTEDIGSECSRC